MRRIGLYARCDKHQTHYTTTNAHTHTHTHPIATRRPAAYTHNTVRDDEKLCLNTLGLLLLCCDGDVDYTRAALSSKHSLTHTQRNTHLKKTTNLKTMSVIWFSSRNPFFIARDRVCVSCVASAMKLAD